MSAATRTWAFSRMFMRYIWYPMPTSSWQLSAERRQADGRRGYGGSMSLERFQRIVIVGPTGSGKSTLGAELARVLGGDHVELDALHWEPRWKGAAPEVFQERLQAATTGRRFGSTREVQALLDGAAG